MSEGYLALSKEELQRLQGELQAEYEGYKAKGLRLDMSRGKPSAEQLDLAMGMLDVLHSRTDVSSAGLDCRNYGLLEGLPEMRALLAPVLGVPAELVVIGGNSSLNMMYDCLARAMLHGVYGSEKPWCRYEKVKFLCPVPGYDRHFAITEHFGVEMINVPMTESGPDMDMVERLVAEDETIKGIWCVPKYSNPQGISYSDETVRRFAALRPKASDFRIFWDNAYAIHHLDVAHPVELLNLYEECCKNGTEDMVYLFCSTSKISFAGSGVAAMAASEHNLQLIKAQMSVQTIGHDKLNQLRHVLFYKDMQGVMAHMAKHAAIIAPKFRAVLDALEENFAHNPILRWREPKGGYFISVDLLPGCAKRTVALCKEAGVVLTGAGATFPYGRDPQDSNLRLAPTYPPVSELQTAIALFCLCAKLATVEKLLQSV